MLALSGQPMGLSLSALVAQKEDPAAQVIGSSLVGSLQSREDLKRFLKDLDFVTVESEFVDTLLLQSCLPKTCRMFPSLQTLSTIQDRLTQKQLLDRFKIPTSPWMPVQDRADLQKARTRFPEGFVLKQRRFGYDGYGTFVYRPTTKSSEPLDESPLKRTEFGFIAESLIGFKRELAISFVRSSRGEFLTLPLVESVQVQSRCFSVVGPIRSARVTKLSRAFQKLMQEIDYQGLLAVEMFDAPKGLLVNELAPRVHNSGHYSQDALTVDQFEYHLRAGLGLPLPKVELLRPAFAMINLLGGGAPSPKLSRKGAGHLHWYGKRENRAGRKLGHINVLAKNPKQALQLARQWHKEFVL